MPLALPARGVVRHIRAGTASGTQSMHERLNLVWKGLQTELSRDSFKVPRLDCVCVFQRDPGGCRFMLPAGSRWNGSFGLEVEFILAVPGRFLRHQTPQFTWMIRQQPVPSKWTFRSSVVGYRKCDDYSGVPRHNALHPVANLAHGFECVEKRPQSAAGKRRPGSE